MCEPSCDNSPNHVLDFDTGVLALPSEGLLHSAVVENPASEFEYL